VDSVRESVFTTIRDLKNRGKDEVWLAQKNHGKYPSLHRQRLIKPITLSTVLQPQQMNYFMVSNNIILSMVIGKFQEP
jgi:hypothetical protein